jgi:cytochrome c oxidase subunit II
MSNLVSTALFLLQDEANPPKFPESPHFWVPLDASTSSGTVDGLFDFIMWISIVCSIALMGAMIYFVTKYRAPDRKVSPVPSTDHNTFLELIWSIVPMPFVLAMFIWGFHGFVELRTSPKDAYEVHAQAQKWKWLFTYENGHVDDVLHVPVDRKVRVVINSVDVLHSLYFPTFRQKMDAVPGRYTELWFEANKPGDYPVFCAEYCGTSHSDMITNVIVHEEGGFENWLVEVEKLLDLMPPLELGEKMYNQQGCATCHSLDGTPRTGPSFQGIFGKTEEMSDGTMVLVDENYIRESILDPQAKIVKGYPPAMPTYQGKLSDKKIDGLIEFIKAQK